MSVSLYDLAKTVSRAAIDVGMERITELRAAALATLIIVLAVGAYYYSMLPVGSLQHIDEYTTLDRVGSLVRTGDWLTVLSENRPTLNKPPLQYWASAILLQSGLGLESALRLPSFVSAILVLLATGFLAFQLCPRPVVFPVSALILASSFRYWQSALSALLDLGAAFFITVALGAFIAARKDPRWWYGVALAVGIGSLQKAPVALGVIVVAAAVTLLADAWQKSPALWWPYANRHFRLAICLLVALLAIWPILQVWRYGYKFLMDAYIEQMWSRFAKGYGLIDDAKTEYGLFRGQPFLEVPLFGATLLLPAVMKRAEAYAPPIIFVLLAVLMLIAGRAGSVRYSMLFYPMMAASLSAIIAHYLSWKAIPAVMAYSLILGTPWKSAEKIGITKRSGHAAFLSKINAAMHEDESLVYCVWKRKQHSIPIFPGEISYYASGGRPIIHIRKPKDLRPSDAPYRGICTTEEFSDLQPWLDEPALIETSKGYVHWTARRRAPPPG